MTRQRGASGGASPHGPWVVGGHKPDVDPSRKRDTAARNICAEVIHSAIKDLTTRATSTTHPDRRTAQAAVFLASTRATPWMDYIGLDHAGVLAEIGFASIARRVLDGPPSAYLDERERRIVRRAADHLEGRTA